MELALLGSALDVLQSIPTSKRDDFVAVSAAFECQFGVNYLRPVFLAQLRSRIQKQGETLEELAADIETLFRHSCGDLSTKICYQLATQSFIDVVQDPEMLRTLRLGHYCIELLSWYILLSMNK